MKLPINEGRFKEIYNMCWHENATAISEKKNEINLHVEKISKIRV